MKAGEEGFVRLFRSIKSWGWYTDVPTSHLFMHLLVSVNWQPGTFLGMDVQAGSLVTSHAKLAQDTGLTMKQVRRALNNLQKTGEICVSRAGLGQLVTLAKWGFYQFEASTGAGLGAEPGQNQGRSRAEEGQLYKNIRREEGKKERRVATAKATIEERREAFKSKCKAVIESEPDRLHADLRKAFFNYWTESDENGIMRFEAQKHFEIPLRMDTWQRNAKAKGEIPKEPGVWNPRA
jgi:hypothetical protein